MNTEIMTSKNYKFVLLGVIGFLLIILLIIGASYAVWFDRIEQTGTNTVATDCLNVTYTDGEVINAGSSFPVIDEDGMKSDPYNFTLTNTCTTIAGYTVKVKVMEDNTLDTSLIKVLLDNKTPKLVSTLTTSGNSEYELESGYLFEDGTVTYDFRTWVDEAGTLANSQNKKISLKIVIEYIAVSPEDAPKPLAMHVTNLVGNGEVFDENGIRYQGSDPSNYVVFDNDDEVYRIIGVFDTVLADGTTIESLVKLIKLESISSTAYNNDNSSNWNVSTLKTLLNTNFLTSSDIFVLNGLKNYVDLIENVTWKLGGVSTLNLTSSEFYNAERGTTVFTGSQATGTGKVGLMYPSDYMYAVKATDCIRTTLSTNYDTVSTCHDENWLFYGNSKWSITPISNSWSDAVYISHVTGEIQQYRANGAFVIYPVIYLNTDASIISGTGTSIDPYVIG